jgi:hypothetical protein
MLETTKETACAQGPRPWPPSLPSGRWASGTVGFTATSGGQATSASPGASRLDDGKDLLPKSNITEEQAIRAAQTAASGDLNEVDLEHRAGRTGMERGRRRQGRPGRCPDRQRRHCGPGRLI